MNFARIDVTRNVPALGEIKQFLLENGLLFDEQVQEFVVVYDDDDNIIACGGIAPHIVKCVATGESAAALKLATEITNLAYETGYPELFVYTKPEHKIPFRHCGCYTIAAGYA